MKRLILLATITLALSCQRDVLEPEGSILGPQITHDALIDRVYEVKHVGKYSDTMTRCKEGGIGLQGNSQSQRAIYYNWELYWKGLPMINRAIGGTTWRSMRPYIDSLSTPYKLFADVFYQGDNELAFGWSAAATIADHQRFVSEWRQKNPNTWLVLLGMVKTPALLAKGKSAQIDSINDAYSATAASDAKALFIRMKPPVKWRADGVHFDEYLTFTMTLRPVLDSLYKTKDSAVAPPAAKRKTIFFGSSTPAQMNLSLFPDSLNMRKAGYGGKTWLGLQVFTDTIRRYGATQAFIYSGANDILAKRSVAQMTVDIQALFRKIWEENPDIHLTYVTIHPSDTAFKVMMKDGVTTGIQATEYVNRNITQWIATYHAHHASVVNSYGSFLLWNPKRLNTSYFGSDRLHLNQAGQGLLASLITKGAR